MKNHKIEFFTLSRLRFKDLFLTRNRRKTELKSSQQWKDFKLDNKLKFSGHPPTYSTK